ncbi:MAG: single-stranded-DNA-specific exonuclease RecJ [Candidatus Saccharibacteria bacterium]
MSKIIWDNSVAINHSGGSNLALDILKKRGLGGDAANEFISPSYDGLTDPFVIPGMKPAVDRIFKAIQGNEKIVIYGDYDIDGLSSCALMKNAFEMMGHDVELYIPDRFEEGYGLNSKAIEKLKKMGFDLVITVDCGTTAHEQLKKSKKLGLDIIITDHHEPDGKAPKEAVACVNPKLEANNVLVDLAGVGVAFYLIRALQKKYNLIEKGQEKWLLDLVALGTICDVVPLVGDNRILATYGLKVLKKTKRKGLISLAIKSGIDLGNITESDLGFKIGPRLNAAGRLAHAQKALDVLNSETDIEAEQLSQVLNDLNIKRQDDTRVIYEEANKQARKHKSEPILVLNSPEWSHGVVGIVASRISEKWHKPVILLQELSDYAKGSARSYGSFSIINAIRACSEILETFGGHTFAAGLKLKNDRIDEFRYRINEYAIANMEATNNFKRVGISVDLDTLGPDLDLYDNVAQLAPFGNGNKKPYMQGCYEVSEVRLVGSDASHLRLKLRSSDESMHVAIGFGKAEDFGNLEVGQLIDIAFELSENIWQERRTHQLEIIDIKLKNK